MGSVLAETPPQRKRGEKGRADLRVDTASLHADQMAALGTSNPALCYQFASGVTEKDGFSDDGALLARENEIQKCVVETARNRPDVPASVLTDLRKKLATQLSAKGINDAQFKLMNSRTVKAARYGEFCSIPVALYREIARLPARQAAILMGSMLADK